MKHLLLTLSFLLSLTNLKGQTNEKKIEYSDGLGNAYVYYLEKNSIPKKFDSTFIKSEIKVEKLLICEGRKTASYEERKIASYSIWKIEKIPFSRWYKLTLSVYVYPEAKNVIGSFGGLTIKFRVKKSGSKYLIKDTKDFQSFI